MPELGFDPQLSAREMRKIKYYERMFAKLDSREVKRQTSEDKSKSLDHSKSWSDHSIDKSEFSTRIPTNDTTDLDSVIKAEPAILNQTINSDYQDADWNYSYNQTNEPVNDQRFGNKVTISTSGDVDEKWAKSVSKKKSRSQKREKHSESIKTNLKNSDIGSCDYDYSGELKSEGSFDYERNQYEIPEKLQKIAQSSYVDSKFTTTTHDDTTYSYTPLTTSIPFIDDIQECNVNRNIDSNVKEQGTNYQGYTVKKCESMVNICPKMIISLPKTERQAYKEARKNAVFENNLDPSSIFSHAYTFQLPTDPRKLSFTSHLLNRLKNKN